MNHRKKTRIRFSKNKFGHKQLHFYAKPVLISGLIVTIVITFSTCRLVMNQEKIEFLSTANEIKQDLITLLESHALMLRAGVAYFAMADTVTRNDWKKYIAHTRIEKYLNNVQGMGYSKIVPAERLEQHIIEVRTEDFPEYSLLPGYEREFYTSIVFVEPFTGRNRLALGYDMFTEPVRRRAMEFSRDYDVATLSGRFRLTMDTEGEELYGSLMFVPFYEPDLPANTIEQRREAIRGWLYSPYHLKTFMDDIFEQASQNSRMRVQIFDEMVSESSIMYDNQSIGTEGKEGRGHNRLTLDVDFNANKWYLIFTRARPFPFTAAISLITGTTISILLYFLFLMFAKIERRSQQLKNKNKELKTLNATKDKFFSIITHDLKSPYNAVMGFSDVLISNVDKMDRQEIEKVTGIIRHTAGLAVDLLTNLVIWSQSHTGRIAFDPKELNVVSQINNVVFLFNEMARQKNIEIVKNLPTEAIACVDAEMLNTVLRNLLSNAIKFTNTGGQVTISAEKKDQELLISVVDTGVGIAPENIKKLFRIDESYTTAGTKKEKGTGLGLILCREFVEKHGGRIWAESKIHPASESGSTFFFTLPVVK